MFRKLSDEEMANYRAPFLERESRLPTLVWPRQIPIEGEPADVAEIVESYGKAMSQSAVPKLLIIGEPGAIVRGRTLEFCRTWPNQTEITVKGVHFLQEDSPREIGSALQNFVKSIQ
jgi:haloalkane dehalogenase